MKINCYVQIAYLTKSLNYKLSTYLYPKLDFILKCIFGSFIA